jgi:hypothetical protein
MVDQPRANSQETNWLKLYRPWDGARKLLVLHHGGGNLDIIDMSLPDIESWLERFAMPSQGRLQILVNVKQLPVLLSFDYNLPVFESPIWQLLLNHREHIGIVVSLSALRRAGAAISFGLSWEKTADDFCSELHRFPQLHALSFFSDVFVRIETAGLIHLKNGADPDHREAQLYFEKCEKERKSRNPEVDGRIVGKNTLLLVALATCVCGQRLEDDKNSEAAISKAIVSGLQAAIATYNKGYDKDIFLNKSIDKATPFQTWTKLAKNIINGSSEEQLSEIITIPISKNVLGNPYGTSSWDILGEMLSEQKSPVPPVNVALAIVQEGAYRVLNRAWINNSTTSGTDERIRTVLYREAPDPKVCLC